MTQMQMSYIQLLLKIQYNIKMFFLDYVSLK